MIHHTRCVYELPIHNNDDDDNNRIILIMIIVEIEDVEVVEGAEIRTVVVGHGVVVVVVVRS